MGLFGFLEKIFLNKIEGKTGQEWFNQGAKERDPAKKVECFGNVTRLKPNFVGAWNLLGSAHAELGNYEKALKCYEEALEIRPSYTAARHNKENIEKKMKEAKQEAESRE